MPRTRASAELRKRRAANLESYHRNADRHNKKRYCKRIATGAVSRMQLYTLEKYNMTPDDFNRIRTDNGLAPVPSPHDAAPPCTRDRADPSPPAEEPEPPAEEPEPPAEEPDRAQPSPPAGEPNRGRDMTLEEIIAKIEALTGRRQINAHGVTTAKTLSQTTINNYITTMRRVVKVVMKCSPNDLVKCLREGDKVVRAIESRYTNSSTKRDYFNRIYSPSKYIPEYKAAIGEEALAKYHARMLVHAKKVGEETTQRTVTGTVLDISVIKSRVPAVKEKFGAASAEYIAALLQTNLWGLRAELGTVKVINRESQARTYPNYYLRPEGKLVVRKFKTMQQFPDKPYTFPLNESLKRQVEASLVARPRAYLLMGKSVDNTGAILKKGLGVAVNDIRHSRISDMLKTEDPNNYSLAKVQRVADCHRHSLATTLSYWRDTVIPNEDEDV
eukprot:jgi/Tetstr1/434193/TSEL_023304.t1